MLYPERFSCPVYRRFFVRLLLVAAIAASAEGIAAPAVTAVSGTLADGSQMTINGSGFGQGDGAPLFWDDFEAGVNGTNISNAVPRIGAWTPNNGPYAVYTTAQAYSGSKSLYAAYTGTQQWSNFLVSLPVADRFYQSFRFWWSSAGTQGQLKLAQIHGNADVGDFAPGVMIGSSTTSWWFTYISKESDNDYDDRTWALEPVAGQWHQCEIFLKRSSAGGVADGSVQVMIDGVAVYKRVNVVTRENSQYNWNQTGFFYGVTNMGARTDVYIDDAYVNDSWARVILSDSATYSGIKNFTIQPATSWSEGSISVTLRKGSYSDLRPLYLYVVDAVGNANQSGYKVSGTTVVPEPPQDVRAN